MKNVGRFGQHLHFRLAMAMGLLTSICGPAQAIENGGAPVRGGTLIYASDAEPTCLDPHVWADRSAVSLAQEWLDSLVSLDSNGQIGPWLATSWSISPDGKSYTFHLREDVTFTDGEKFDSAAVKANFDRMVSPSGGASTAISIAEYTHTDSPDPYTAIIHLSKPNSLFLRIIAQNFMGMEAPDAMNRGRDVNCQSPVGSGPFKIVAWQHRNQVVLTRNPSYNWAPAFMQHQGPAYLDKIIWRFMSEPSVRFGALRSGIVDVIDGLPPEDQTAVTHNPDFLFVEADHPGIPVHGTLNTKRAPFNDIRLREAFIRAANIEDALASVFFGVFRRETGPLSPPTAFYSGDFAHSNDYDPALAKKLLDEAGWKTRNASGFLTKGGEVLTVHIPIGGSIDPAERSLWEQVQATEAQVGFNVILEPGNEQQNWQRYSNWDYDLTLGYCNGDTPDCLHFGFASKFAEMPNGSLFHSNSSGFSDPDFDVLIEKALATQDPQEQNTLFYQVQKTVASQYLQLRLYPLSTRLGIYKTAHGVHTQPPLNVPTLYDAWVKK